jgi:hypothetical protein
LPRNWLLQRLAWRASWHDVGELEQIVGRCVEAFFERETEGWRQRYESMSNYYRNALASMNEKTGLSRRFGDRFDPELAIAFGELSALYGSPSSLSAAVEPQAVSAVEGFLFEANSDAISLDTRRKLTLLAVAVQSGLPPRRGLVKFQPG